LTAFDGAKQRLHELRRPSAIDEAVVTAQQAQNVAQLRKFDQVGADGSA
jgi:hypothetical protein